MFRCSSHKPLGAAGTTPFSYRLTSLPCLLRTYSNRMKKAKMRNAWYRRKISQTDRSDTCLPALAADFSRNISNGMMVKNDA
mmetsp:Transcript_10337/g.15790  ORF Transcript_10337/g.15790 Transcript_10337/m.15790 type:complete len:82 (+) Transcript_10337:85-330(+)